MTKMHVTIQWPLLSSCNVNSEEELSSEDLHGWKITGLCMEA